MMSTVSVRGARTEVTVAETLAADSNAAKTNSVVSHTRTPIEAREPTLSGTDLDLGSLLCGTGHQAYGCAWNVLALGIQNNGDRNWK
jgi:hypothetical protein